VLVGDGVAVGEGIGVGEGETLGVGVGVCGSVGVDLPPQFANTNTGMSTRAHAAGGKRCGCRALCRPGASGRIIRVK
jgi:hypothetical protein